MLQSPPPDFSPPSGWITFEISAIGVICTIFLYLFIYYRIMKRHCFSLVEAPMLADRSERRRFNEENPDEPSLQFHSRGLDSSVIQCLPTIQYTKKKEGGTGHGETECAVCLGDFEVGVMLRFLPNCRHSFHIACIDTWFKCHSNCPLCRSNVLYDLGDHQTHSVSILTLLETHRREDIVRETAPAAGAGAGGEGGGSHESSQMPTVGPPFQLVPFPSIGLC